MGLGHGIKVARQSLSFLAMQDELVIRMELATGVIRELRTSSRSEETSKKNGKKIDRILQDYETLNERIYEPRDLEILASKLVEVCVGIIEDNTQARSKK